MPWLTDTPAIPEQDADPILASIDALQDAVALLGSIIGVVGLIALWLLVNL